MTRTIPFFAETATATIVIDGVTYRVPLIDSAGHLQVDVVTSTLPALAATSAKQDTMITALQLIDDLRGALAAVHADRLNVNAFATGAGEVLAAYYGTSSDSTTRATVATPATGKKIRLVDIHVVSVFATKTLFEVYFGTATRLSLATGKEIAMPLLDNTGRGAYALSWPDGAGPVGAVNDVVSLRTQADVDTSGLIIVHYREE